MTVILRGASAELDLIKISVVSLGQGGMHKSYYYLTASVQLYLQQVYDRVSDVVENGGRFASKILTHNRMH